MNKVAHNGMAGFFQRVFLTTTVVTVVVSLWLWASNGVPATVCFAAGVAVSLLMLSATIYWVNVSIKPPGEPRPRRWMTGATNAGKFVAAGLLMYLLSRVYLDRLVWVAVGYGMPIAVMVLKVLGMELNRKLGVKPGGRVG